MGPAPEPRPHSSSPVRSRQPPPPTWSGRPPGPARPASDHRQGRGLLPAPGSPSSPEVRAGTAIVLPRPARSRRVRPQVQDRPVRRFQAAD
ncbi:hypothetical protein NDU88_001597 [Pleurodeles waltl]|uniref:Uncharacterized protein n=1 Tax=Pleurodeles waltl TaxID=8319 RepID=A0AAV7NB74_PLEWA|nr:hypothetical protein NDU88_000146 [Pleurodeles waltl]KAJ1079669.1 hypothetical protein NDU88_000084 [Pleurodeles waltl]KAJ1113340.1 hypothetical protein NDU88_001586 [Pleurodeles waltl]KAJ1113351.1 hypothetical protein NDU88_001597 [Pleurodeles waltl]